MSKVAAAEAGSRPDQLRRVALASAVGTTIEWYDYFIYSTAAALVFGSQFFSTLEPASATLAAFATLGVGFLARPIGGILWGHFGDRVGRKAMLIASLLLMGFATVGVGLLPTYDQIGLLAPVLLLVLRLLQGLSAGGEWGGAALMAVEHAPEGKRGRYGSYSQIGVPAGLILAQLVFVAVGALSDEQFASWGWRLPFLFSIVLVGVGLFIRLRVEESPVFAALRAENVRARVPMIDVVRERPRELLVASVSFIANTAIGYVFLAYLLSYGTSVLKVDRTTMLVVVIIGSVSWLVSIVVAAQWSDRVGRKPVYL
ncbi:MAG: MFS transporter, partial [Actinomycetota bacterium]|nr:MFS transporter [Actinomycetota bacterium]